LYSVIDSVYSVVVVGKWYLCGATDRILPYTIFQITITIFRKRKI